MDKSDDFVGIAGAVNTVVNRDGRLEGFNTDGYGFLKALREDARFEPAQKNVVILGAGGAARAVAFTLLDEKVSSLVIANRSLAKAENLTAALKKRARDKNLKAKIAAVELANEDIVKAVTSCQLIVNCTTVGMKHSPSEGQSTLAPGLIPKGALVYDLVYNPLQTPLLKVAGEVGASTLGGLPMLVYQGAASFQLWTGKEAPLDIMLSAARKALAA
jgi:shikimate dehydrogenase